MRSLIPKIGVPIFEEQDFLFSKDKEIEIYIVIERLMLTWTTKNEFTRFLDLKFSGISNLTVNWIPKATSFKIEKIGTPICED